MNKNIKYFMSAILLVSTLLFNSCSESMLDEKLYSQLGSSSLPSGKTGAEQLVLGIYPKLQTSRYQTFTVYTADGSSDVMFINWGGIPETGWAGRTNFLFQSPNTGVGEGAWTAAYQIIAQCNEVLRIFSQEAQTNSDVKIVIAEATFWRAFFYHRLVRTFGDVPLVTGAEDLTNGIARTNRDEVIKFVVSELKSIEDILPATRPSSEYGRPTKWAVEATLANLFLNEKDWNNASIYAKDVIDNGRFSLMPNYHDVFGVDENSEVILVSVCIAQYYRGNNFDALSLETELNKALQIQGVSGSNGLGLSVPFFNTFDPKDKRREDFNPETKKGIMIHGYIKKLDGTPLYQDINGNPLKVEQALNRIVAFKYPLQENPPAGEWMSHDMSILRLGEVYLTYAEAQNELNGKNEALKYTNLIRQRAGLPALSTDLSQSGLRDAILNERGWELYTEGFRRDDLIRHNKLLEKIETKWQYYLSTPFPSKNATYRHLFPIPASAMIKNPLLTQNPGYSTTE